MKSQKDFESNVREEARKLTVQPSGRAWRKLERRLDHQQTHRGRLVAMRQWLAVAASLLVLVTSLFLWSGQSDKPYDYRPTMLEVIGGEGGCSPYCMTLEARKTLPAFYTVPGKVSAKDQS